VETSILILTGLKFGIVLSLVLSGIMLLGFAISPDLWVGDYPPDIRENYGEMSERGRRYRPLVAVLFFGALVAVIALAFRSLETSSPSGPSFIEYFLTSFVALMVFNLFDLVVLDWLLFMTIQPRGIVLAGTEGMAGYRDFRFHARGFLIGIAFSGVAAAILSAAATALQALFD
jgi:hypothetical protein